MKRLTPIFSAVLRPLEGDDEDTSGGAALVGVVAGDFVDAAGVDEEEEPVEEGKGDDKDDDDDDGVDGEADGSAVVMAMKETFVDDDDAIIIGPEAVPDKLTVDGPQVCGGTAPFDVILNSGVSPISEVVEYSSSM